MFVRILFCGLMEGSDELTRMVGSVFGMFLWPSTHIAGLVIPSLHASRKSDRPEKWHSRSECNAKSQ